MGNWTARIKSSRKRRKRPQAFIGAIAAGEKVVASTKSDVYQLIKQNYGDSLAVEMEGYGFHSALHTNQSVSAIVIREISDLDGKAKSDKAGWQVIAFRECCCFCI